MSTASVDVSDVPGTDRPPGPAAYRDEDFPGCESFHLPAGGLEHHEGRLELRDGDTESATSCIQPVDSTMFCAGRGVRLAELLQLRRGHLPGHPVERNPHGVGSRELAPRHAVLSVERADERVQPGSGLRPTAACTTVIPSGILRWPPAVDVSHACPPGVLTRKIGAHGVREVLILSRLMP